MMQVDAAEPAGEPRLMKILLLTETLHAGGAETFVVKLANALSRQHDVTLAVMHGEIARPELVGHISDAVRVERFILPGKRALWRIDGILRRICSSWSVIRALQYRWLTRLVNRDRPDAVHSHLFKADLLATMVKSGGGVKSKGAAAFRHIITLHGDYAPFSAGEADPQLNDFAAACDRTVASADALVGVAHDHLTWMTARYGEAVRAKCHLIYNGYEPFSDDYLGRSRTDLGLPEGKFLFGMVARGIKAKGWQQAVDAFARLQRTDTALILVGDGEYLDTMRAKPHPDGVIFAGFSGNPLEYIQYFDVGLLPTYFPSESLPTVIIEYLYCGKPVIATDIGEVAAMLSMPDIGGWEIDSQSAGWLLSFANKTVSVPELAERLSGCLDGPAVLADKSALASQVAAKFAMPSCVTAYERLYRGGDSISS